MKRKIHREDIIEAGCQLMHLNGYGGTGIKDITEKVQIPKGSFYNHFKSKEEFGIEVLRYYMKHWLKTLDAILSDNRLSALDRLKSFFRTAIGYQNKINKCKLGCLCGNLSQELGDINDLFSKATGEAFAAMRDRFQACIQEALDADQIKTDRDSKLLADFLINSWEGALLRMKSERSTVPLEQFCDIFFQDVLR